MQSLVTVDHLFESKVLIKMHLTSKKKNKLQDSRLFN